MQLPIAPAWSSSVSLIGITGTNGKTSTTTWLAAALSCLQAPVLRITTVGAYLADAPLSVASDYDGFVEAMRLLRQSGGHLAAIELTSEALALGYAKVWPCRIGVFTNLTRDHLDSHGSAEHYLASKAQLFVHLPAGGCAVLHGCDPASALLEEVVPPGVRVVRYGQPSRADPARPLDLCVEQVQVSWQGTRFVASGAWLPEPLSVAVRAIGDMYAENAAAALAGAIAAGVEPSQAVGALAASAPPAGRFEVIGAGPRAVVDYAHTPDALRRTLEPARGLCKGRLTAVFGAGGNRDRGKRGEMGAAAKCADRVIVTSDNPRHEDPADIAASIREGLGKHPAVDTQLDRALAIRTAISGASVEDVIVIAGKGHERVQWVGEEARPFCDQQVVREAMGE